MTPYYQDEFATIYHGDCREILPQLEPVDLVLTDPPYGISLPCDYAKTRMNSLERDLRKGGRNGKAWSWKSHKDIQGDDQPFDPAFLLGFDRLALFGAQNYADKLPAQYSWLVWDKRDGRGANCHLGDGEMIYCRGANFESVRIYRHLWIGYQRDSEVGQGSLHPTQKPIALMKWILGFFSGVSAVIDPFMGSGPTLRAAKDLGIKSIGIEIEEKYCEIAAKRLQQGVLWSVMEASA